MTSQIDIANRALLACGARTQVSSINPSDGSVEANAISTLWNPTFEQLGRTAYWNCLRKELSLSLLAAAPGTPENANGTTFVTPPQPWLYAYSLPSDCLAMRYIMPTFPMNTGTTTPQTTINNAAGSWLPSGGQIPYVVSTWTDANNQAIMIVLTNQDQATAVYTVNQPNPAIWDSQFQAAMVASLAAFLAPALTLSIPLMQTNIKMAEVVIGQARTADGNEGVTVMDHLPDWMAARAGSVGSPYGWGGVSNLGGYCYYNDVSWPGGSSWS